MARIRRHLQRAAEAFTAADAPRDEDGLESGAGRDDQSAAEAACVSVAAGLGQNSARSSYPDPLARRRSARGRTHELRVNAARGGHPPSPSASDVVDVRSPTFCVTPVLDLA